MMGDFSTWILLDNLLIQTLSQFQTFPALKPITPVPLKYCVSSELYFNYLQSNENWATSVFKSTTQTSYCLGPTSI